MNLQPIGYIRSTLRDLRDAPRQSSEGAAGRLAGSRSPNRPNPLGLHTVTVRAIEGTRLRIGPIEAIDGTPVVDIKAVW